MRVIGVCSLLASAVAAQADVQFERDVLPIVEARCLTCHRSLHRDERGRLRKPKGGLVLDTRRGILRGGDEGTVVEPGRPDDSPLYTRTVLPADDDDIMPAKGDALTAAQTAVLRAWIAAGADFGDWVAVGDAADAAPAAPQPTPERVPARVRELRELGAGVRPLPATTLAKAAGERARIEPVQPDSPLLRVEFIGDLAAVTDRDVAALAPLAGHVAHLDLRRTQITDAAMATVARMPKLVHLDLRETKIGDAGVRSLAKAKSLRSLNLFATAVTDASVDTLAKLSGLRAVYLWKSKVTEEGARQLGEAAGELVVRFAPKLPSPAQPAAGQRRRR